MGGYVDYRCKGCRTEESPIPVGRGRNAFPYLALFRCLSCKTVGSTWVPEQVWHAAVRVTNRAWNCYQTT